MPDGGAPSRPASRGSIGPNAILQLEGPLDRMMGQGVMAQLLDLCRIPKPTGQEMIPQESVERVHHTLWQLFPEQAARLSEEAGRGTASYIRDNRIPRLARFALRLMPAVMGERLLTRAIARHAWTFCGSGRLAVKTPESEIHFIVADNPLADHHGHPPHPCHWHAAVFEQLFTSLLGRPYACAEKTCCGCGGAACRFVITRGIRRGHFKSLRF